MNGAIEICAICGCMYVPSEQGQEEFHKKIHDDVVNGIRIQISKKDQIVTGNQDLQLLLIDENSTSAQCDRLKRISGYASSSVSRDALFSYHFNILYPLSSKYKFFLLCSKNRAIGYLDMQFLSKGLEQPVWLVKMVWLAVGHRRKGFAKYLVEGASNYLGVSLSSLGWEAPFSEMGLTLVESLCPDGYRVFQTTYG